MLLSRGAEMASWERGNDVGGIVPMEWKYTLFACIVGVLLLLLGFFADKMQLANAPIHLLFHVSGISLVLGAFGSYAIIKHGKIVMAGIIAMAVILYYVVGGTIWKGIIRIDIEADKELDIGINLGSFTNRPSVSAGDNTNTKSLRYIVLGSDLGGIKNHSVFAKDGKGNERKMCLNGSILSSGIGGDPFEWALDRDDKENWIVYDKNTKKEDACVASQEKCRHGKVEEKCRRREVDVSTDGIGFSFVSSAVAGEHAMVDNLIKDLLSKNDDVRRLASNKLSKEGSSIVRKLMDVVRDPQNRSNDQDSLMVDVSVADIISNIIDVGHEEERVGTLLTPDDYSIIIRWSQREESNLRIPSANILANTASVDTLTILTNETKLYMLDAAKNSKPNPNIPYNTSWILYESAIRMRKDSKSLDLIKALGRSLVPVAPGNKTKKKLDQLELVK